MNYDSRVKEKENVEKGESVWIRIYGDKNKQNWKAGIVQKDVGNAIYEVLDEVGITHRMHMDQLKGRKALSRPPMPKMIIDA